MADDLTRKLQAQLFEMEQRIQRLERRNPLESASVTSGRVRFIGGTLRVDSGGRVEIVGTLEIDGTTTVTGEFNVDGPWEISGNGSITGNVTVTGPLTVNGTWDLNGNGDIAGDVNLTGDLKVLPGGRIQVGDMIIDPADGGAVTFPGGAKVQADPSGGIRMIQGTNRIYVGSGLVSMQMGSRSISISGSGIQMDGLDTITSGLAGGAVPGSLWSDGTEVYLVV